MLLGRRGEPQAALGRHQNREHASAAAMSTREVLPLREAVRAELRPDRAVVDHDDLGRERTLRPKGLQPLGRNALDPDPVKDADGKGPDDRLGTKLLA